LINDTPAAVPAALGVRSFFGLIGISGLSELLLMQRRHSLLTCLCREKTAAWPSDIPI
jgi:hypothetical protein